MENNTKASESIDRNNVKFPSIKIEDGELKFSIPLEQTDLKERQTKGVGNGQFERSFKQNLTNAQMDDGLTQLVPIGLDENGDIIWGEQKSVQLKLVAVDPKRNENKRRAKQVRAFVAKVRFHAGLSKKTDPNDKEKKISVSPADKIGITDIDKFIRGERKLFGRHINFIIEPKKEDGTYVFQTQFDSILKMQTTLRNKMEKAEAPKAIGMLKDLLAAAQGAFTPEQLAEWEAKLATIEEKKAPKAADDDDDFENDDMVEDSYEEDDKDEE